MNKSVCVQFGIISGSRMGKHLFAELKRAGFTLESNPQNADIIIGHSAGCFNLPTGKTAVLIDPPFWPGKSVRKRGWQRIASYLFLRRNNYTIRQWFWRTGWGAFYALFDASRNIQILKNATSFNLPDVLQGRTAIIIRNTRDDGLSPEVSTLIRGYPDITLIEIPGDHDDCWVHPAAYVAAIKQLQ